MQRSRTVNGNGKGAKSTGSKSTGASNSITPPLSSEQQEQKRKLMQEITQFTQALGQTSGGKDSSSTGNNINAIRLRSGRTIPNVTHAPTPHPSKSLETEPSESVENNGREIGTGIQQQNNPFATTGHSTVVKGKPPIATRVPVTRSMKRAAELEAREKPPQ